MPCPDCFKNEQSGMQRIQSSCGRAAFQSIGCCRLSASASLTFARFLKLVFQPCIDPLRALESAAVRQAVIPISRVADVLVAVGTSDPLGHWADARSEVQASSGRLARWKTNGFFFPVPGRDHPTRARLTHPTVAHLSKELCFGLPGEGPLPRPGRRSEAMSCYVMSNHFTGGWQGGSGR